MRNPSTLEWRVEVVNPSHNHIPSGDPKVHSCHRKRTHEELNQIEALTQTGQSARVIINTLLQQNSNTTLVSRDIYNERRNIRKEQLGGLTSIEALINTFEEDDDWIFEVNIHPETRRVTHLFFALSETINLMKSFPDIALMDATYKTNRFKMPLLHFAGMTSINTSFSAAFCFLPSESAEDYLWVLQAFKFAVGNLSLRVILTDGEDALKNACRDVFPGVPQRLCLWHVNQNMLSKAKTTWKENTIGIDDEEIERRKEAQDVFMTRWYRVSSYESYLVISSIY
jgi:hypothetical protein